MHAVNNGPVKAGSEQSRGNFNAFRSAKIPYVRNYDVAFYAGYGGEHTVDVHAIFPDFSKNLYYLEDDLNESYCYPAIISVNDGLLVSYYHSNGTPVYLNSMKIVKIRYDEIEEGGGNADV